MTKTMHRAAQNAANVKAILEAQDGFADLCRTVRAGPSGQRADLLVARVRPTTTSSPYEVRIIEVGGPFHGEVVGWARRDLRNGREVWSIYASTGVGTEWLGHASSLSVGCDVLRNGVHAALGNHDSARISRGAFHPNPYSSRH